MGISDWSSDVCSSDLDPPVDGAGVEALVQVGDDDRLRVDARRPQAQIVAEDAAVRIGKVAVEAHRSERATGDRVEPADARRAPGDRDEDLVGIDPRLAREAQRLDDDIVEGERLGIGAIIDRGHRSEEHTSELQSLMRISYAVFCLKKKKRTTCMNTS